MRIILDENLPRQLASHLPGHDCRTVVECGWSGRKNGELLALAETQFDVVLTLDKNLPYQQDLSSGRIAVMIVRARSSRIQDLLPVIPACLAALDAIRPRQVIRVSILPPL
jgi:predicted nuclease of predicted toxin-antitoxin system